jgi:hypothetical protein
MEQATFQYSKDHDIEEDLKDLEEKKLPPLPRSLRKGKEYCVKYDGDIENYYHRIFFKLFHLWLFWWNVVTNEDIIIMLEQKHDPDSEIYKSKHIIIDLIDHLGSILSFTEIDKECAWLRCNEKENTEEVE